MKKWLILLMTLLLPFAVLAEEEAATEVTEKKTIVYFQDGSYVLLPNSIVYDDEALAAYCGKYFPGRSYTLDPNTETFVYDAVLEESYAVQRFGEDSRAMAVRLVKLGIVESIVANTQSEEMTVPTRHLIIRDFADPAHQIATVHAPRSGKATLRKTPNGNGEVIAQAKAGRVVALLEYTGATYSKVLYDGKEGYIRTDCLTFHAAAEPLGQGTIHIKGVTDGKKDVTIRATASGSTAKVASFDTGTLVTVHAKTGDWYAVEYDGWYGFVPQQYLEMKAE